MISHFKASSLAITAVLAAMPTAAAARTLVELEPTSDWVLSERPASCAVSRMFEADGKEVLLQLENRKFGLGFEVSVLTGDFKLNGVDMTTGFLPGEIVNWGMPHHIRVPDGRNGVIFDSGVMIGALASEVAASHASDKAEIDAGKALETLALQRELTVDHLLVGEVFSRDLSLHTGALRPAMVVMRMCEKKLAQRLGLDPAKVDADLVDSRPSDMDKWSLRISQAYPTNYLFSDTRAEFDIWVGVDAAGKVTDCRTQRILGPADFSSPACTLVQKEAFLPALDARGQPKASVFHTRIGYGP